MKAILCLCFVLLSHHETSGLIPGLPSPIPSIPGPETLPAFDLGAIFHQISNAIPPSFEMPAMSPAPLFNVLLEVQDGLSKYLLKPLADLTGINPLLLYTLPEFSRLSACDWIQAFGYVCEEHKVITEDGYILSVQRIMGVNGTSNTLRSHPVILSHGLLTSGRDWVLSGKPKSIAFELADNDVDVWIVSHRGTDLSNFHVTMNATDPGFYNYSFHEMGIYDLPAVIDYVKLENGADQVIHVGFSQGGSAFYVMFAEMPEYVNENVKMQISISPGVQLCHVTNALSGTFGLILDSNEFLTTFFESIGHMNYLELTTPAFRNIAGLCYNLGDTIPFLCPLLFGLLVDYSAEFTTNRQMLPLVLGMSMKVTSSKQILHYNQNLNYCDFYKYRGGLGHPFEVYNLTHQVDTKLITFTSVDDHFIHTDNVLVLQKNLTNTPMDVYIMDSYYHENLIFDMGSHDNYRNTFFGKILSATTIVDGQN